jgi:TrmH family RNA methyltransferase
MLTEKECGIIQLMHRVERITSRQNAVVKRFRDLARAPRVAAPASGGNHAGEILLDGEHLLLEALACGVPIEIAAFSDRQAAGDRSPLGRLAKDVQQHGGRSLLVSEQVLAAISPVRQPSGVVAIARAEPSDARAVFAATRTAGPRLAIALVLAGLQDPGNVGAAIRAAAAFGAAGVVTIGGTANPFGWKALRGAMGGTFRIAVAPHSTLEDVVAAARAEQVRLVAAVPRNGTALPRVNLREPTAIILGNEGAGVSGSTLAATQETVTIPMQPPVDSLNVAVAAALILYEASRQMAGL